MAMLWGQKNPMSGLEAKFSTYHCVAVALIDGLAGQSQFTNNRLLDKEVKSLREKVNLIERSGIRRDEAIIEVKLANGKAIKEHVKHVIGSPSNPLSDGDLKDKFQKTAGSSLPNDKINRLTDLIWNLEKHSDLREIIYNIIP